MNTETLIAFLFGLLALASIVGLYRELRKDVDCHERRIHEQEKRILKLETSARLRMPQRAQDELLDAIAMFDADIDRLEVELEKKKVTKSHIMNAMSVGTKQEK